MVSCSLEAPVPPLSPRQQWSNWYVLSVGAIGIAYPLEIVLGSYVIRLGIILGSYVKSFNIIVMYYSNINEMSCFYLFVFLFLFYIFICIYRKNFKA